MHQKLCNDLKHLTAIYLHIDLMARWISNTVWHFWFFLFLCVLLVAIAGAIVIDSIEPEGEGEKKKNDLSMLEHNPFGVVFDLL